ncbi:MAG TPA: ABC transporter permease [Candidatus Sulfopaludibacter sp.]|jgi:predicted permease|nr:ABC transporter permease [Candidatus Sulfopaludibacter sp.]
MLSIRKNLQFAIRSLGKSRSLAAVGIISIALGIGVNITAFTIVRELVFNDVTARHPERLAYINADVSSPLYRDLRHAGIFQDMASYRSVTIWNWRNGAHSEMAWTIRSSANFFDVLGVTPFAGRLYSQSDEGRNLAVVSYSFWRKRLGGDLASVGRPLQLNGRIYTIAAILGPNYRSIYGSDFSPQVYVPEALDSGHFLVFGRLLPGRSTAATRESLRAAVTAQGGAELGRSIAKLYPVGGFAGHAAAQGDPVFPVLMALYAVAGLLALIGCANAAGLLLARSVRRQREIAIRKAVGASRWQIVRHLLAEGCVMAGAGTMLGYLLHTAIVARLRLLTYPGAYGQPYEFHFETDAGLVLYAAAIGAAALLFSSLVPALRGASADLSLAIRQAAPPFSVRRWSLRSSFVGVQMALSVVLLALGVFFTRGFLRMGAAEPGFDIAHTLFAGVQPVRGAHAGEDYFTWRGELLRAVRGVSGVAAASSTTIVPLSGELSRIALRRDGEPSSSAREAYRTAVGDQYFTTFAIPILRGRDFEARDRGRSPLPTVINRLLARELFGAEDPVGRRLVMGRDAGEVLEIVGVCGDTRVRTLAEDDPPAFYVPGFDTGLVVRVAGDPALWIESLRRALGSVDPDAALDIRTMREATEGAIWPIRMASLLLASLSGLGLALALVGLYASVSDSAGRRTREMAIRVALGATPARIVWVSVRDAIGVLLCGGAVGTIFAIAAIHPVAKLAPAGVDPWSPAMFTAVLLLLLASGCAAAYLPARRAAKLDPSAGLREE